jgi:hypothetical protein
MTAHHGIDPPVGRLADAVGVGTGQPVQPVDPASPWCQRWRRGRPSWSYAPATRFDPRLYDVAAIPDDTTARSFVQAHHYSHSYPAARTRFGLHEQLTGQLVGVAVFSIPTRGEVLTNLFPDLEPYSESCELGRFCLLDNVAGNAETWFLARCWEELARLGVRGVVSFSDPVVRRDAAGALVFPGHIGTIYRAANATFHGHTTPRTLTLLPSGEVFSDRLAQKVRRAEKGWRYGEQTLEAIGAQPRRPHEDRAAWLAAALRQVGARRIRHGGCFRYAFRLGPLRRTIRLGLPAIAYPKATRQLDLLDVQATP